MASKNRIQLNTFEVSRLISKPAKTNAMGSKNVPIGYMYDKEYETMMVQTPRMLSFGINKFVYSEESYYSVTFSFIGIENDEKLKEFHDFLVKLDTWGKELALKNSWEWLGIKNISSETIDVNYHTNIKTSGKHDYIKMKLRKGVSGFTTTFFNKDKEVIDNSDIELVFNKGSYVRALLECNGFWVSNGKLGISWKIKQMIVEPRVTNLEYAFTD